MYSDGPKRNAALIIAADPHKCMERMTTGSMAIALAVWRGMKQERRNGLGTSPLPGI